MRNLIPLPLILAAALAPAAHAQFSPAPDYERLAKDFIAASGRENVDFIEVKRTMTLHADPGSSWSATYYDCDDMLRVLRALEATDGPVATLIKQGQLRTAITATEALYDSIKSYRARDEGGASLVTAGTRLCLKSDVDGQSRRQRRQLLTRAVDVQEIVASR